MLAPNGARAAIARLVRRLADSVVRGARRAENSPGPDNLHDLRVAVRRIRAVLDVLVYHLQPTAAVLLTADLKSITSATGPLRDADVRRASLLPLIRDLPGIPADMKRDCAIRLEQARVDARKALRASMRETPWLDSVARIRTVAREPDLVLPVEIPLEELLTQAIGRELAEIRRRMRRRRFGPRRLHRIRLRIRSMRYVLEAMSSLLDRSPGPLARILRRLQDSLGFAHDLTEAERLLAGDLLPRAAAAAIAAPLRIDADRQVRRCRRKLRTLARDPPPEWRAWLAKPLSKSSGK